MTKRAYRFGAPVCGAHSYSGPPRGQDEVLGPLSRLAACGIGRSIFAREGGRLRVADFSGDGLVAAEPIMEARSSTMPERGACPLLEDGAGLGRRGYHGQELKGLEAARMCLLRCL